MSMQALLLIAIGSLSAGPLIAGAAESVQPPRSFLRGAAAWQSRNRYFTWFSMLYFRKKSACA